MFKALSIAALILSGTFAFSQGCCSGGAGSPLSGGASTGVLENGKMEVSFSHEYFQSNKFFSADHDTTALFGRLSSNYMFIRADYGITDKLTLSLSTGYFLDKSLYELEIVNNEPVEGYDKENFIRSSSFGDLIIFPRYGIFNKVTPTSTTELSLGLGLKIPLGAHNDSSLVFTNPTTGKEYYAISPPTIQTTNGSNDFMFYSFFYKGYPLSKLRLFANALYIKKGWNSLGQKFGDYMSIGLFAGTTIYKGLGLTGQIKAEYITKMRANKNIDMLALYNIDMASTGSKKVFFVPQISYTFKSLTVFALADIPLYQYLEGTQVGSQYQFTGGLSYRFFVKKPKIDSTVIFKVENFNNEQSVYEEQTFKVWGNCDMCKETIEKAVNSINGIKAVNWNVESKMLVVSFDNKLTSLNKIKEKIASVGYDTETHKAPNKVYNKLHSCCKYERPGN